MVGTPTRPSIRTRGAFAVDPSRAGSAGSRRDAELAQRGDLLGREPRLGQHRFAMLALGRCPGRRLGIARRDRCPRHRQHPTADHRPVREHAAVHVLRIGCETRAARGRARGNSRALHRRQPTRRACARRRSRPASPSTPSDATPAPVPPSPVRAPPPHRRRSRTSARGSPGRPRARPSCGTWRRARCLRRARPRPPVPPSPRGARARRRTRRRAPPRPWPRRSADRRRPSRARAARSGCRPLRRARRRRCRRAARPAPGVVRPPAP